MSDPIGADEHGRQIYRGSARNGPPKYDGGPASQMSLRDHFAAAALTGLILHYHEEKPVGGWHKADDANYVCRELSECAYDYADAMLAERRK